MAQTSATGAAKAGLQIEGVSAVEIKVTVQPDQELLGLRALKLDEEEAEPRKVFFYDFPNLALFDAGVILRARLVKDGADDSTVKVRPVDPADIHATWPGRDGFKLEADITGDRVVCSASFTVHQKPDEIDDVAQGKRPIEKLFSKEQTQFLDEIRPGRVDFARLRPLGPIRVLRWKTERKEFPHALTAEEWRFPNGKDLLEVSIKVAPAEAHAARRAFDEFLHALNLDSGGRQEAKTRTALESLASGKTVPGST